MHRAASKHHPSLTFAPCWLARPQIMPEEAVDKDMLIYEASQNASRHAEKLGMSVDQFESEMAQYKAAFMARGKADALAKNSNNSSTDVGEVKLGVH